MAQRRRAQQYYTAIVDAELIHLFLESENNIYTLHLFFRSNEVLQQFYLATARKGLNIETSRQLIGDTLTYKIKLPDLPFYDRNGMLGRISLLTGNNLIQVIQTNDEKSVTIFEVAE
jgi:hypothetical protein